jgi:hypothetical protein
MLRVFSTPLKRRSECAAQLFCRQLSNVLVFILFDEYADNFLKRSEGVRFVFANFIDQPIEQGNQSVVFSFS